MRILESHIDAFGRLRDVHFDNLDRSVVVVLGPNEAGKSTLFHFLKSMLYGFYPATRDDHPYRPDDGATPQGRIRYRLSSGDAQMVSRRLMSAPSATLLSEESGSSTDLRNQTIPAAKHVPMVVFESVFALTLSDLTGLDGKAWQEVQDRLLGGLNLDFVRPVSKVLEEIDEEASRLWRSDRLGKPRSKELNALLRDLRGRLADASQKDETVRRHTDEILRLEEEIKQSKADLDVLGARRNILDVLLPIRRQMAAVERLRHEAGDVSELAGLPADPAEHRDRLQHVIEDAEAERAQIAEERVRAERAREAFDPAAHPVLKHADAVEGWLRRIDGFEQRRAQVVDLEASLAAERRLLELAADAALATSWSDEFLIPLSALPVGEIRHAASTYRDARTALQQAETAEQSVSAQRRDTYFLVFGLAALVAVFVFGLLGLRLEGTGYFVASATAGALGLVLMVLAWLERRRLNAHIADLEVSGKAHAMQGAGQRFAELVKSLPVSKDRSQQPDEELVNGLADLKRHAAAWSETRGVLETISRMRKAEETELRALAGTCGVASTGDPSAVVALLERDLKTASELRSSARAAEKDLLGIDERLRRVSVRLREAAQERQKLDRRLSDLGDGDVEQGLARVARRRRAAEQADTLEEQLRAEHPDLEQRLAEIARLEASETVMDEAEKVRVARRLEEIDLELKEQIGKRARLESDRSHLLQAEQADEVASEIASVEQELADIAFRHDRLRVISAIIRTADQQFRYKHQPDVLRRTGDYLSTVTSGRYDRVELDDEHQVLQVFRSGGTFPIEVRAPLSQGTRDQIYLALRLALADHLDDEAERLPMILDEVFVNWDARRRMGGWRVLKRMAAHRQIFLFTCHPWLADEVSEQCDAARFTF